MSGEAHEGWSNYETWTMDLWINNDEKTYKLSRALVREVIDTEDDQDDRRSTLARELKEWQESKKPDLDNTVWSDLLTAAFSEIDWVEIADDMLAEGEEDN